MFRAINLSMHPLSGFRWLFRSLFLCLTLNSRVFLPLYGLFVHLSITSSYVVVLWLLTSPSPGSLVACHYHGLIFVHVLFLPLLLSCRNTPSPYIRIAPSLCLVCSILLYTALLPCQPLFTLFVTHLATCFWWNVSWPSFVYISFNSVATILLCTLLYAPV